jgi:CheY-like chemotaxis protein
VRRDPVARRKAVANLNLKPPETDGETVVAENDAPHSEHRSEGLVIGRLLVVHDDPAFTCAVRRSLRSYSVVERNDRAEALLGVLRGEEYDLILCDVDAQPAAAIAFRDRIAAMNPALAARVVFLATDDVDISLQNPRITKPLSQEDLRRWVTEFVSLRTLPPRGMGEAGP